MAMHVPQRFAATDTKVALAIIENHGFATLITPTETACQITHLPMLLDQENNRLLGHMALANEHHRYLEGNPSTAIFMGPHAYMSPNWYISDTVPTWNYAVVHVQAMASLIADAGELFRLVDRLTQQYESPLPKPWIVARDAAVEKNLQGIVGFRLPLDSVTTKLKLDQHLGTEAVEHLATNLESAPGKDHQELAAMMRRQVRKKGH
ncbi:MAG: FMN-binding negative transcriptional regulator [Gammaproteobacteria bacterium]|nr:FMN-binding negative transcriptional regulator [Gammaproteobacteria bacterium]